jgi:hypothetical protein
MWMNSCWLYVRYGNVMSNSDSSDANVIERVVVRHIDRLDDFPAQNFTAP